MKKKISLLCLFVLGLLLLPKLVLAEDLPREGVHYFLIYPNGEEIVTRSYAEATSNEEKLMYSGLTGSNGEVVLEGLLDEGSLRIVQKVPNGYTTDTTEVSLDLSQGKSPVEFVDYKGVNPKTGQSILFMVGIIAIVLISIVVVKKDSKKLFIIPVLLLSGLFLYVKAENENLVITIKDKEGNKLANVEVEVYAKPVRVEAAPAVTFDANGGKFLDGKDKMYFRLPSSPCTGEQLYDSLTEEEIIYMTTNFYLAQREGYVVNNQPDELFTSDELTNDTIIKVQWMENNNLNLFTIHGNGGVMDYHGNKITTITTYGDFGMFLSNIVMSNYEFKKDEMYQIGFDDSAACNNYDEHGLFKGSVYLNDSLTDVYVCWNAKPDGIYVNDIPFIGNTDNCYEEVFDYDSFDTFNHTLYFNGESIRFMKNNFFGIAPGGSSKFQQFSLVQNSPMFVPYTILDIHSLEIVENGRVILSLTEADITKDSDDYYTITNTEKAAQLLEYYEGLYACYSSTRK